MDSVTEENVAHIIAERDSAQTELDILLATSLSQMWMGELNTLEREYDAYKVKREQIQAGTGGSKIKIKAKGPKPATKKVA